MEKQIKNFLEFLENEKKVSKNTLQSYERDILQYNKYLEEEKLNYLFKLYFLYNQFSQHIYLLNIWKIKFHFKPFPRELDQCLLK